MSKIEELEADMRKAICCLYLQCPAEVVDHIKAKFDAYAENRRADAKVERLVGAARVVIRDNPKVHENFRELARAVEAFEK